MPEILSIRPADLLIDLKNPRIPYQDAGQREALHRIAKHQDDQLLALAAHIIEYGGLSPADLPIAMPSDEERGRYVVLDGNRRLATLRALEAPDSLGDALSPALLEKVRRLSARYQQAPIKTLQCVVMNTREEAKPWIDLRHQGPASGAGIVPWSSDAKARNKAQGGGALPLHIRLLNFLEESGNLAMADREKIKVTTLKRLVDTAEVRRRIGIEVETGGGLRFHPDEQAVIKALLYVIHDITAGPTKVKRIYEKEDRVKYAREIPADKVPLPAFRQGGGTPALLPTAATSPKRVSLSRMRRERTHLIPSDCFLKTGHRRLERIEVELRDLRLKEHKNAVAVLFRVFIELSADECIKLKRIPKPLDERQFTLAQKLKSIVTCLRSQDKITVQEAAPVLRACEKESWLAPSVRLMHDYVHNVNVFPGPDDLRSHWDSLQPFIEAMWKV